MDWHLAGGSQLPLGKRRTQVRMMVPFTQNPGGACLFFSPLTLASDSHAHRKLASAPATFSADTIEVRIHTLWYAFSSFLSTCAMTSIARLG
jgi:hypothetical protein